MKKLIALALFGTLAFVSTANAWTVRTTVGGGPNGYYATQEKTDDAGNKTITCQNPGQSGCPTAVAAGNNQLDMNHALNQIAIGVLVGNYTNPMTGHTVSWNSTTSAGTNATITLNP